ncbi:hypothetical protein LVJ94_49920 [Pendulispora rubella]|uniref:Uncharacterized protein n=1 Tax=Pendulispora rubella TaxID=2741070 RepID=A0ABZ2L2H8_9BACT
MNDVAAIGALEDLRYLALTGYNLEKCDFLSALGSLESVYIGFGGGKTLDALRGKRNLRRLELMKVSRLEDFAAIGDLEALEWLKIEQQARLRKLPSFERVPQLKFLYLDTVDGLQDLSSLDGRQLQELLLIAKIPSSVVKTLGRCRAERQFVLLRTKAENAKVPTAFAPNNVGRSTDLTQWLQMMAKPVAFSAP